MSVTVGLEQAVLDLDSYLPQYIQRKAAFPDHPQQSPRRARRLLDLLGKPDGCLASIRIIGTKGKGSTAAMLEASLRAAGLRTGLYTSPHLHSPRERICVGGSPISRHALTFWLHRILPLLEESLSWKDLGPATLFEGLTAIAMAHFAHCRVELAVIEAGMGGQSDATHALAPLFTLLTPIALDHQIYLGSTLEAIAQEKIAGVHPGGLALSVPQPTKAWAVIQAYCRETGTEVRSIGERKVGDLGLAGPHQRENAQLAWGGVAILREQGWQVPDEAVQQGLRTLHWPGRLEPVAGRPLTLVDAAHNPAAAQALARALAELSERPRIVLLGCSSDKDAAGIVAALAPLANGAVVTQAQHYRAVAPEQLATLWRESGVPVETAPQVDSALWRARSWAGRDGLVCACGSLFVVAEVREALGMAVREPWPEPLHQHHPPIYR